MNPGIDGHPAAGNGNGNGNGRRSGEVVETARLGVHDHICWSYADHRELRDRVVDFLLDGLGHGLRVCYVGPEPEDELLDHLRGLPGLEAHLARGALQVASLSWTSGPGRVMNPDEQVQAFAAATGEALAAGFSGLRVAAEMTERAITPEQVEALAAYEHLLDRFMTSHPFSAMCAYRSPHVPLRAAAEIACMHPLVRQGSVQFRLYATDEADAALAGEVDVTVHTLFQVSLGRMDLGNGCGRVVIDGRELRYIDHRGLFILRDHARRLGTELVLRTANPGPARVIDVLELDGIVMEVA